MLMTISSSRTLWEEKHIKIISKSLSQQGG